MTSRKGRKTAREKLTSPAYDRDSNFSRTLQDSERAWQACFVPLVAVGTVGDQGDWYDVCGEEVGDEEWAMLMGQWKQRIFGVM